jgi:hypothetical protein
MLKRGFKVAGGRRVTPLGEGKVKFDPSGSG